MNKLVHVFSEERAATRARLARIINPQILVEKIRGITLDGKDEKGVVVNTREPSKFGIFCNCWLVEFPVHRDDKLFLAGLGPTEANEIVKAGAQRKRKVNISTDIYHAVRLFKHIKEGYRNELKGARTVQMVEGVNAMLATLSSGALREEVEKIIGKLIQLEKRLGKKKSAPKLLALDKLERARKALEEFLREEGVFKKMNRVGVACALLVAFRNRYEEWRLREILRRGSMAKLKECALRIERDEYIKKVLKELISTIEKGADIAFARRKLWEGDQEAAVLLEKIGLCDVAQVIPHLEQMKNLWGTQFLENAKRKLNSGEKEGAILELRKMYYCLCSNKPKYIANEIEKTGDRYLIEREDPEKTFVAYLRAGATLFEDGVFKRAAYCFRKALEKLDII